MKKVSMLKALPIVLSLTVAGSVMAYAGSADPQPAAPAQSDLRTTQIPSGTKAKVKGLILRREGDTFVMRQDTGSELTVHLQSTTKVEEKKSNPFRSAKKYPTAEVIRGLTVEVEGRGDSSGALVAEKIKFSDDSLMVARALDSQVVPVEQRLGSAEGRLTQTEQNAERLSGQVQELGEVANLARGGAKQAQDTADAAVEGVNRTNERISTLDEYEEKRISTINFRVGSSLLTPTAKTILDEVATQAKNETGFVIEVRGFASSDGSESLNRRLSQRRAEAVVQYLGENHNIPLRRIILPFGYGEMMPVADNTTREGREQNRRVEVRILVNRGLTTPVDVNRSDSGSSSQQ